LVAAGVDAQHPEPGAVIDGGELGVLLAAALLTQRFAELDVDPQLVAGALLLVALPAQAVSSVALGGGQPVHPEPLQDPLSPEVLIVTSW
jgi:hypothetical protein